MDEFEAAARAAGEFIWGMTRSQGVRALELVADSSVNELYFELELALDSWENRSKIVDILSEFCISNINEFDVDYCFTVISHKQESRSRVETRSLAYSGRSA